MKVESTMSGSVWQIKVQVGDSIEIGDVVVILESMKMEIPIETKVSGKVQEIKVSEGDFVQEGDSVVLLTV